MLMDLYAISQEELAKLPNFNRKFAEVTYLENWVTRVFLADLLRFH